MPECNYCEASFDDEEVYLTHLGDAHEGELGRIDRRRVEGIGDDGRDLPTGPVILAGIVLGALALVAYTTLSLGGSSGGTVNGYAVAQTPGQVGSTHTHGTINVTIDGQRVDFSRSEYQLQADAFHFEGGNGRVWHGHATGITLEYAMATLGIGVTDSSVTFQGRTYNDSDPGTSVEVTVDGEPVDPSSYVLQGPQSARQADQGDHVRIVVETDD